MFPPETFQILVVCFHIITWDLSFCHDIYLKLVKFHLFYWYIFMVHHLQIWIRTSFKQIVNKQSPLKIWRHIWGSLIQFVYFFWIGGSHQLWVTSIWRVDGEVWAASGKERYDYRTKLESGLLNNPGRLTWHIIIGVWKIIFLSKWVICMFHVNLPGCTKQPWKYLEVVIEISRKWPDFQKSTLLAINIYPFKGTFEDGFPFAKVGYVSSLEGNHPVEGFFFCGSALLHPMTTQDSY